MKLLLHLDEDSAKRLELFNRAVGGRTRGGGKKSAILRWLIETHLPTLEELEETVKYNRMSGWQREKVKKPETPKKVEQFREITRA